MSPASHWPGYNDQCGDRAVSKTGEIDGGRAQSKLVHFSVGGLDPEDSAVATFTDSQAGKTTATVTTNGTVRIVVSTNATESAACSPTS